MMCAGAVQFTGEEGAEANGETDPVNPEGGDEEAQTPGAVDATGGPALGAPQTGNDEFTSITVPPGMGGGKDPLTTPLLAATTDLDGID